VIQYLIKFTKKNKCGKKITENVLYFSGMVIIALGKILTLSLIRVLTFKEIKQKTTKKCLYPTFSDKKGFKKCFF